MLLLPALTSSCWATRTGAWSWPPEHADKIVPGGNGVFKKTMVAGGEVIGTWARHGTGQGAAVVPELFDDAKPLGPAAEAAFNKAAKRVPAFLAG